MTGSARELIEELGRLRERVHAVLEEALLRSRWTGGEAAPPGGWSPAVDVVETAAVFILSVELPGVGRDEIDLAADGRRLVLTGRRPLPSNGSFAQMERSYGPFRRVFELPEAIEADGVSAALEGGVLTVTVPKHHPGGPVAIEAEGG